MRDDRETSSRFKKNIVNHLIYTDTKYTKHLTLYMCYNSPME